MKRYIAILITGSMLFLSCRKEESSQEFFIIGSYYGECLGEGCIRYYKIAGAKAYEDTLDVYPSRKSFHHSNGFIKREVPHDTVLKVLSVLRNIPGELYRQSAVVGRPDETDQGGLYLEVFNSEAHRYWYIDQKKSNIPAALHSYTEDLNNCLRMLR